MSCLLLHGVIPVGEGPGAAAVLGEASWQVPGPVSLLGAGKFLAIVRALDPATCSAGIRDLDALRGHETVTAAFAAGVTVLPVPFGRCWAGADELIDDVKSATPTLLRAVEQVSGAQELAVSVAVADRPCDLGPSGRDYLEGRSNLALRGEAAVSRVRAAMSEHSVATVDRPAPTPWVARVACLVRRADVERFRQCIDMVAERGTLRTVVTGPWPPYSFTPSSVLVPRGGGAALEGATDG